MSGGSADRDDDIRTAYVHRAPIPFQKSSATENPPQTNRDCARRWISDTLYPASLFPFLGPREMEIAEIVEKGLTHSEISKKLGISIFAVKFYIAAIRNKLVSAARMKGKVIRGKFDAHIILPELRPAHCIQATTFEPLSRNCPA